MTRQSGVGLRRPRSLNEAPARTSLDLAYVPVSGSAHPQTPDCSRSTVSNATNLQSYRQRKRDRGYKRLDVWIPAHCCRNLHELKTGFDQDLATVLIRLLRHRRRSRGWKNVREAFLDTLYGSTD